MTYEMKYGMLPTPPNLGTYLQFTYKSLNNISYFD